MTLLFRLALEEIWVKDTITFVDVRPCSCGDHIMHPDNMLTKQNL